LEAVKAEWEAQLGEITDIWIPVEYMEILDPRPPLVRIQDPYMLGNTFVTVFSPLKNNQLRIAFLTECDLGAEDIDESTSVSGSTSGSEQASGASG